MAQDHMFVGDLQSNETWPFDAFGPEYDLAGTLDDMFGQGMYEGLDAGPVLGVIDPNAPRLQFSSIYEAQAAVGRLVITAHNDDWVMVENNPTPYVQRIMQTFHHDFQRIPPAPCKSVPDWIRHQNKNVEAIEKSMDKLELAAWMLVHAVLKTHKLGPRDIKQHRADPSLACSTRLETIINLLSQYTICRFDVIRQTGIESFVANPDAHMRRKFANFNNNGRKREQIAAGREVVANQTTAQKRSSTTMASTDETEGEQSTHKRRIISRDEMAGSSV